MPRPNLRLLPGEGTRLSKSVIRAPQSQETRPEGRPMTVLAHWKAFSPDFQDRPNIPGPGAAGHGHARHGSSQRRIRRACFAVMRGRAARLPHQTAGDDLSVVGDRRVGAAIVNTLQPGDKVLMPETDSSRCYGSASPRNSSSTSISCPATGGAGRCGADRGKACGRSRSTASRR